MPDEADEIARDLWEGTWDWEDRDDRSGGIAKIADALREFARKAVMEDRKTICGWIEARGWIAAEINDHPQR